MEAQERRVDNAYEAVDAYCRKAYGRRLGELHYDHQEMSLTYLLCDLRHYADANKFDWTLALDRANMHYRAES